MSFKMMFFISLAIIIVTNFFWLYSFINRSVTYDHLQQETTHLKENINLMKGLMVDFSRSIDKEKIVTVLTKEYSNQIIKEEDEVLFVDNIGLKFENNKLTSIIFMNE